MNNLQKRIKELARIYHSETVALRRHFHANPELSGEEEKTAQFIAGQLDKLSVEYKEGVAKHGIVALVKGKNPDSKCIALRADMDALPINESNEVSYKSKTTGVMHACGHDAHMASMLGTVRILKEIENEFEGTIKVIFQPSEEKFPGGAKQMIEEGVLQNPETVHVIGQHALPTLDAGKVGFKSGQYMASTDEVYLTVSGKGGHAATPDINIDPVVIGSHIIVALQQIVSRYAPPAIPTVLSFGRFIADGRTNIIPHKVKIDGTFRTFNEEWRSKAHKRITEIAKNTAESMGGKCEVFIDKGYPFLVNESQITDNARKYAVDYLGEENVEELDTRLTAEDFAYFSQAVPSCFYRFGVKNEEKGIIANLHTPEFDIDEKSLESATGLMAWIGLNVLLNIDKQ